MKRSVYSNKERLDMPRYFIVIVGKLDAERFRQFRASEDDYAARLHGSMHNAVNVWALSAASGGTAWNKIEKGDEVFFAEYGSRFVACGTVSGTARNSSVAVNMWGDTPRMRMLDHLVMFSEVREISEPFSRTCREAGIEPSEFTALHEAAGHMRDRTGRPDNQTFDTTAQRNIPTIPPDRDGPPEKATESTTRFVRNAEKARRIKRLYLDKCQVCGITISIPDGKYSEVHHLRPLKEDGDDNYGNMVVLCPNHHVGFDCRAIGISDDGSTIIDWRGREVGRLTTTRWHTIDQKNILYHMEAMRRA